VSAATIPGKMGSRRHRLDHLQAPASGPRVANLPSASGVAGGRAEHPHSTATPSEGSGSWYRHGRHACRSESLSHHHRPDKAHAWFPLLQRCGVGWHASRPGIRVSRPRRCLGRHRRECSACDSPRLLRVPRRVIALVSKVGLPRAGSSAGNEDRACGSVIDEQGSDSPACMAVQPAARLGDDCRGTGLSPSRLLVDLADQRRPGTGLPESSPQLPLPELLECSGVMGRGRLP